MKLGTYLVYTLLILILVVGGVQHSVLCDNSQQIISFYEKSIQILVCICMLFNIFVYKVYSIKKFIIHFILSVLIVLISGHINNWMLCYLWFILLCFRGISFQKICKITIPILTTIMVILFTLFLVNLGNNMVMLRPSMFYIPRYSFGFDNPNMFGVYVLQLCSAYTYLKWNKWKRIDNLFLTLMFVFVFFGAHCRTVAILLAILIFVVNIKRFFTKEVFTKILSYSSYALLFLCPVVTFLLVKLYSLSVHSVMMIDELISYRIRNLVYVMNVVPIDFFGNVVRGRSPLYIITNVYGKLFANYGVFAFCLFIYAFIMLIKKSAENKDAALLTIIILNLLLGISEEIILYLPLSFATLAFSCLLNNEDLFKKD